MTFKIVTDSSCDFTIKELKERDIDRALFSFEIEGKEYFDDGISFAYDDFYKALESGSMAKTSAVNTQAFIEMFEKYLKEGRDIVCVTMSSQMSSTYNNALRAKEELNDKYPNNKIYVIDSKIASLGVGLILDALANMRDSGKTSEEAVDWVEKNKLRVNAWVATTDLKHFVRGGRLSAPAGWIGSVLNVCPIIKVSREGELENYKAIRSKKKAYKFLEEAYEDYADPTSKVYLLYGTEKDVAKKIKDNLISAHPDLEDRFDVGRMGTTIGAHTGPYILSIFFWGKEERFE